MKRFTMFSTTIIVLLLVLSINVKSKTSEWLWAKSAGGTGFDPGQEIAVDASGNIYVTGWFASPTITFGSTTLTNNGSDDIFVVKYDASGNTVWAKRAGGSGADAGARIDLDTNGNIYVTGRFSSPTITFGSTTLTNNGSDDIFVVKYDTSGNVVWAKSAGGANSDLGTGIAVDANGNCYVMGIFRSSIITFGSTTLTNSNTNQTADLCVVKYDTSGNVVWAKSAGGTNNEVGLSIAVDNNENSYVTGYFNSHTFTFGSTTLTNIGSLDLFVVKYNASGNEAWAKSASGNVDEVGYYIDADQNGNSYVAGYFSSPTITFDSTTLTNTNTNQTADLFVVKFDSSGNMVWAKSAGGTGDEVGYSAAVDSNGNSYVAGYFTSPTFTVGSTTLTNNNSGSRDIFVVKYDASGYGVWAKSTGGTGDDIAKDIAVGKNEHAYVAGYFDSPSITFGMTTLTNNGSMDVLVGMLDIKAATLASPKHIIATVGPHGIITPSNTVQVDSGGTQRFTITTDAGYWVDSVIVDGINVPDSSTSYTFINVTTDHTIRVAFRPVALQDGLVALWHFDEGSGNILHDASIYHNDGTIYGNTQWVPGKSGEALHFDGLTSYVILPNSSSLKMQSEFTLEAWFSLDTLQFVSNPPSDPGFAVLFSNIGTNPCGGGYQIQFRNSYGFRYEERTTGCTANVGGYISFPAAKTFHHVATVHKQIGPGSFNLKTYLDGVLVDSSVFSTPIQYSNTPYFYVGTNIDGRPAGLGYIREFPGIIDEISIYKRALSNLEIDSLYHDGGWPPSPKHIIATADPHGIITPSDTVQVDSGGTQRFTITPDADYWVDNIIVDGANVPDSTTSYTFINVTTDHTIRVTFRLITLQDGLVAYYPFNGNANDESGNGNNGTILGAVLRSDRFGAPNKSYYFGDSNYVDVGNSASLNTLTKITVSAWMNLDPNVFKQSKVIVGMMLPGNPNWLFLINGDAGYGRIRPHVYTPTNGWTFLDGNTVFTPNIWYHVAMTYDGSSLKAYVNGTADGEHAGLTGDLNPSGFPLTIGSDVPVSPSNPWFDGMIDDIRVYKRVLSAIEIDSLFHEGGWISPPQAAVLRDTAIYNAGRFRTVRLNYSAEGSFTSEGTIDSIYWYVNSALVGTDTMLSYDYPQGTNTVKLVVMNNLGAKDSSSARVTIAAHKLEVEGPVSSGISLYGDSILYVVSIGDAIYKLDYDLNTIYTIQVNGNVLSASSIASDGSIYIGSTDRNLYGFSQYGAPVWGAIPLGGVLSSTPTIDSVKDRIYIGVQNRNFFAIRRSTGAIQWSFYADAPIEKSAIVTLDKKLIFSTKKGTVYGFDISTQQNPSSADWTFNIGDSVTSSPAVDAQGYLYFGTKSGKLIKLLIQRNSAPVVVWQAQTDSAIYASPVIDAHGTIYVGSLDSKFYAFNSSNGGIKWTHQTSGPIQSTAAISNRGTIYVGNDAGEFYALDTLGNTTWSYQYTGAIRSPVLCHEGTVYFGTEDSVVMAFYDGDGITLQKYSTLEDEIPVWGTFQGNNQRTGMQVIGSERQYAYNKSWNMISVPLTMIDYQKTLLYPTSSSNAFAYNPGVGYVVSNALQIGKGYWLKFPGTIMITMNGFSVESDTFEVTAGWNMVGSISQPVATTSITSNPPGLVVNNFFGYNKGYFVADTIQPGYGYWVKANQEGRLILSSSTTVASLNHVQIIPDADLPPSPPDEKVLTTLPKEFGLEQNYPNPFNPSTSISYAIPREAFVTLKVYDLLGQEVAMLVNTRLPAGFYTATWDASNMPSGMYICKMTSDGFTSVKKMVLMK